LPTARSFRAISRRRSWRSLLCRPSNTAGVIHRRPVELSRSSRSMSEDTRGVIMKLEGSCHCKAVRFSLESAEPYPFMRCYCSICRKTAGGGYAINLGGDYRTLAVEGREHLSVYRARMADPETGAVTVSEGQRHFCKH